MSRRNAVPLKGPVVDGAVANSPVRAVAGGSAAAPVAAALLPIGALAQAAGVSTRTVRYYEEIGLLRTARRFAGGRRVFDGDALERLRFIGRLKRLGFTLEEIRELNDVFALQRSTRAMLDVLDGKLGQHLGALEEQLRELTGLRTDLDAYRRRVRQRLNGGEGT